MSLILYPSYCGTRYYTPLEIITRSLQNAGYTSIGVPVVALHHDIAFEHPIYNVDPNLYYRSIYDRGDFIV